MIYNLIYLIYPEVYMKKITKNLISDKKTDIYIYNKEKDILENSISIDVTKLH